MLEQDFSQDEMGVLRAGSANNNINSGGVGSNEPFGEMSFLEFESLYTLEKELMQSRVDVGQAAVDERQRVLGWAGGRRGLYTELPDPLCAHQPPPSSLIPSEGFSFAPGWSLSVDHFYQWQRRGRATHQVSTEREREKKRGYGGIYSVLGMSCQRHATLVCFSRERERERGGRVDASRAVTN